jgi:hypothetical protein
MKLFITPLKNSQDSQISECPAAQVVDTYNILSQNAF